MAVIDPTRTWRPLEERLATTTSERQRVVLGIVIEHMKAESAPDLDALMATMAPNPNYHFWNGGKDTGPKGFDVLRQYYADFVASRTNVLEFEIDRLVVDDDCVVTEGYLKQIYPGDVAVAAGLAQDASTAYLVVNRQLILWPVDADGKLVAEDSYQSGPTSITAVAPADLPQAYVDIMASA
ncbi:nuclear transport factor 2 family protein [Nocardioides alcanivorans]|uniref:nuclear transport factor 2 family protein n=1 Tax=Nocardioides alcanivorans TaxID=2897352 RepID=UPI001F1CF434|nr:nuclear transport factor 2 family protein [Nocardioides alcanivorans]